MASYVGDGRVTDVGLFDAKTVTAPFDVGQLGRPVYDQHGNEFKLVLAGGVVAEGALAIFDQADPGDALAATPANLTALASDTQRREQKVGAAQCVGGAVAGQAFWVCTKKVSNEQGDIQLLAEAATAAGAPQFIEVGGSGGIDDAGASGSYAVEGIDVTTGFGPGLAADAVWPNGIRVLTGTIVP